MIQSGEAAVFLGGKKHTVLEPGDYFGEISARSCARTASSAGSCSRAS
ncbi:MAG TPA: hypothetical protein VD788_00545 [Candidatus Polarisedimenticolaceae bacterium]|nr:hypothetical protein [Candidatus Polarisedimenticolaceae bacterium]